MLYVAELGFHQYSDDPLTEVVFSYKCKYPFSNRTELLAFLKDNPILIADPELELTYKSIDKDLEV